MAAYDLEADTIGGAEKTAPNWQSAEMAANQKYNKRRKQKYTIKRLLACLLLASWVLGSAIKYEMLSDHLLVRSAPILSGLDWKEEEESGPAHWPTTAEVDPKGV